MNLFIIDNGFDTEHDLPTSYLNFKDYIQFELEAYGFLESIDKLSYILPTDLWSEFEKNLGELSDNYVLDEASQRRNEFNDKFDYGSLDESHITDFLLIDYFPLIN